MLWLLLFLSSSLNIVIAQFSPSNNCSFTLDTTVPQFCYATLQNRSPQRRLNFTVVTSNTGVTLNFRPLPENHQVRLEVDDDNSNGLKGWASVANSFVDSVRSGGLPYDIILSYLNNTVESPIASQCPSSSRRSSGTGDVNINDILDEFGSWWTPIIVVTALGPVFAAIFIVIGCIFCWCRLCGKCGGSLQQDYYKSNDAWCFIFYMILVGCTSLLFVGTVFAFVSNEKLNDSIRNFNNTINTAIDHSLDFVKDTQIEANITVDRYDEVNAFVQCEINNTHISIGSVVIDVFENAVSPLINSSIQLGNQLNASVGALEQVSVTVNGLVNLTQRLQMELNNLSNQVTQLRTGCTIAGLGQDVCDMIPSISYTVNVDYTVVDNVTHVLNDLRGIDNITAQALEANDTFYGIPCVIRDQISNQTQDILSQVDDYRRRIFDITIDIEEEINDILDEDGFVGDVREQSSDIQEILDGYDTPRYIISIVICSLTLVVIVVLIVALVLGTIGFRRDINPDDRTQLSNCGGITLMAAVGMMFVFAVILLLLSSVTFFLGANLLKVCYSVAEDPPNDLPSYELFAEVVDNPKLWGGSLLGCYILDNSSIQLNVTDILNGCEANGALYQVAQLAKRPELNLSFVTNISSQIPDLDDLFERLRNEITFTPDQILTEDTRDSIRQYSNAGLQSIDYLGYIDQINTDITNLNVDDLISAMRSVRAVFDRATGLQQLVNQTDMIIVTTQRINNTTLAEIRNLTDILRMQINELNATAAQLNDNVNSVLDAAEQATNQLLGMNGTDIVINQTRAVLNRVIAYADSYANWAIDNLENQIGRCRPLYATYSNVYYDACELAVDGINGFWLAIGWCVLFFIPTIIFAVLLSRYFRRMILYHSTVAQYDPDEVGASGTYHRMRDMKNESPVD